MIDKDHDSMLYYSANERLNDDVDMAHKIPAYYGEGEKRREKKIRDDGSSMDIL